MTDSGGAQPREPRGVAEIPSLANLLSQDKAERTARPRDQPFRVFVLLLNRTLGEFVDQNIFAAHLKNSFDNARLYVYYRDDRPYKTPIVEMNPYVDYVVKLKDKAAYPLDYFDVVSGKPIHHPSIKWYSQGHAHPDLVVTPSMMDQRRLRGLNPTERLRMPADRIDVLERRLEALGLDRARWFCTLHYRESGFRFRPDQSSRDHDPRLFERLAGRIIDDLGGQVVRIGHPEMTRFAPRPGLIDLAPVDDGFMLQAMAVSRARFHLATPSGTATLAGALGTPHALVCDVASSNTVLYGDLDYILCSHLFTPEGYRLSTRSLFSRLFREDRRKEDLVAKAGFRIVHNSLEELLAMARHMIGATPGVDGWREPSPRAERRRANRLVFPLETADTLTPVVEFPELAPPGPVIDLEGVDNLLVPVAFAERLDGPTHQA